jgi:hypothetical protein
MQISRIRRSVASSSLREFRTWLAAVSLFRPRGSAIDQVNQPNLVCVRMWCAERAPCPLTMQAVFCTDHSHLFPDKPLPKNQLQIKF